MKRRIISLVILVALLITMLPIPQQAQAATSLSTTQITAKLNSWKSKLDGRYWNYYKYDVYKNQRVYVENCMKAIIDNGILDSSNPSDAALGVTREPCSGSNLGSGCQSNDYGYAWQCHGFALWIEYALFRSNHKYNPSDWTFYEWGSLNNITLQPGDFVNYGGHSAIVLEVSGDRLSCVECYGGSGCQIKWSNGFNGSRFTSASALLTACKNYGGIVCRYKYVGNSTATYTISYNANGGTCTTTSQTVSQGQEIGTMPAAVRSGYIFDGWYVNNEKWSFIGYGVVEDITLTAKWEQIKVPQTYTVTFDSNGGSAVDGITVKKGEKIGYN